MSEFISLMFKNKEIIKLAKMRNISSFHVTAMDRYSVFKGVVIKAENDWRGSGGLKLQCIRNCHVF